jgi:hypothetical protein
MPNTINPNLQPNNCKIQSNKIKSCDYILCFEQKKINIFSKEFQFYKGKSEIK